MKILLVIGPFISLREPYAGGTESFVVELANELVRKGHSVDVIAKDTDERNLFQVIEFEESVYSMKDNAYRPCPEWHGQQHYQVFQYGTYDVSSYDIIHYSSYIPEIYEMGALFDKPAILTLHVPPLQKLALLYGLFVEKTGAIPVSVSKRMHDKWRTVLKTSIPIITNGIPIEKWPMQQRDPQGYMLWCGRLAKEKNVEAAIALANYLDIPLKIVGSIFDQDYFDNQIKPLLGKNIEYMSYVSQTDLNKLAASASLLLATATWDEPFGLSTLEMLASGLPVVGFASAVPLELRNGSVSTVVESTDWHDLIEPIKKSRVVSSEDCKRFADNFSIEKTADKYVELYRDTINRKKDA